MASVLVNGSPTFQFKCEKGLRQGDPISPFLFLIVMECLSWMLEKAKAIGVLKGISLSAEEMDLSHLFYADDALILGEWSRENLQYTARILRVFYLCSGLRINLQKSNLFGIGTEDNEVDNMMEVLGCKRGTFPFNYLGIKVGAKMSRINNWSGVIEVIKNRLISWKTRHLSFGGRIVLIRSVLENLPIYYLSLYKAPRAVIDNMETIIRRFLWAGSSVEKKINWVAWNTITLPKKQGGLGLTKLQQVNDALLLKWTWRFKTETRSLWKRVVLGCHGSSRTWTTLPCSPSVNSCWKHIVKVGEKRVGNDTLLNSYFVAAVGNGSSIRFWADSWLHNIPLRFVYPNLFRIERFKWATVADRIRVVDGVKTLTWDWRRDPSEAEQVSELFSLLSDIYDYEWKGGCDSWKWTAASDGIFSVKRAKQLMQSFNLQPQTWIMKWKCWTPLKCKVLAWRAAINRLPTKDALRARGVSIQNQQCVFCSSVVESSIHLFTGCCYAAELWSRVASWCRLPPIYAFEVTDLMDLADYQGVTSNGKFILRGILITSIWALWNERNNRLFNDKKRTAAELLEHIKSTSFFWIRYRSKFKDLDWVAWCNYPLSYM